VSAAAAASEQVASKPARDERGRLLPGSTGNPGGRPKDVLGPALLAAMSPEEWASLVAEQARAGNARALEIYADRTLGKVPQTIAHEAGDPEKPLVILGSQRNGATPSTLP